MRTRAAVISVLVAVLLAPLSAIADTVTNPDGSTTTTTVETRQVEGGTETTTTRETVFKCTDQKQKTITERRVEHPDGSSEESTTTSVKPCGEGLLGDAAFSVATTSSVYGASSSVWFDVDSADDGQPTGTVDVYLDERKVATVRLDGDGTAEHVFSKTTSAGEREVDLVYSGDSTTRPTRMSTRPGPFAGPLKLLIDRAPTRTSLSLAASKIKKGKGPVVTVQVRPLPATLPAVGSIRIYSGSKRLKSVNLTASDMGRKNIRLPGWSSKGSKKIRAVYVADRNHKPSKSSVRKIKVT
jgi:hypothetical protein